MAAKLNQSFSFFALFAACLIGTPSGATEMPPESIKALWVVSEQADVFDSPNGKIVGQYKWAEKVQSDRSQARYAPLGWVAIRKYTREPSGQPQFLWIRRSDLWAERPRRVISCWPVKRFSYEVGDYGLQIDFNIDGSAVAKESSDNSRQRGGSYKAQVFLSEGIVQIQAVNDKRRILVAGLSKRDHRLYPEGSTAFTQQELFSEAELKDCKIIPQTVLTSRAATAR